MFKKVLMLLMSISIVVLADQTIKNSREIKELDMKLQFITHFSD